MSTTPSHDSQAVQPGVMPGPNDPSPEPSPQRHETSPQPLHPGEPSELPGTPQPVQPIHAPIPVQPLHAPVEAPMGPGESGAGPNPTRG